MENEKLMISAEVYSDDQKVSVTFDAVGWFEQASVKEILSLAQCGWSSDYPADQVALYYSDLNKEVGRLFWYADKVDCGYECSVDEDQAMVWLKENRPKIWEYLDIIEETDGWEQVDVYREIDENPTVSPIASYTLLKEPLSPSAAKKMMKRDGTITGVVEVDLDEVIKNDLSGFDDLLEERLIAEGVISDINYSVVGVGPAGILHIQVVCKWNQYGG
jgi:hypothetical protein